MATYSPEMGLYPAEAEGRDARKGPEKGVQQRRMRGGGRRGSQTHGWGPARVVGVATQVVGDRHA